jgi:uncharacterized protein YfiM (DUF2279 family)
MMLALVTSTGWSSGRARAEDDWLRRDKGLHFSASVAIAAGGYGLSSIWLERPGYRALAGAGLALSAGIGKEIWDASGHGDFSGKDLTWDLIGTATGVGVAYLVDWSVQRVRAKRARAGARTTDVHDAAHERTRGLAGHGLRFRF